ncbi:MAG: PP2C family serine/threonine-protein phosphatase, partial [Cyanobacteriota bacterium]
LGIVADGIGGGNLGQRAAQITVDSIVDYCLSSSIINIPELLGKAVGEANRKVYVEGTSNSESDGMCTTVAIAAIVSSRLYVANVGDSRVYLIRNRKELIQLTVDHTWAWEHIRDGKLSAKEAFRHPNAGSLVRSVGSDTTITVDLGLYLKGGQESGSVAFQQQGLILKSNDVVLVCSDGLVKPTPLGDGTYVSNKEIVSVVQKCNAERAAKTLVDIAIGRNVDDNVTAVIIEMP